MTINMENNILKHRMAVMQNIQKSFNSDLGVESFDDIEKGKWNIGDTKVYQGVTYEVGGFNSKGSPLWKKKKESGSGDKQTQNSSATQDSTAKTSNASQTAPQTPPESKNLSKISQVEEYAKSLKGVKFADAKTGWGEKNSKAFELTYPNGGKLFVDFYSNGEYVYKLTDSNGNRVIETSSTDMTKDTDWERKLNPDELISDRLKWMEKRLIKLKTERTKLKNKYFSRTYSFTDKFYYEQAQKEVDEMNSKIQKFKNLRGTF